MNIYISVAIILCLYVKKTHSSETSLEDEIRNTLCTAPQIRTVVGPWISFWKLQGDTLLRTKGNIHQNIILILHSREV